MEKLPLDYYEQDTEYDSSYTPTYNFLESDTLAPNGKASSVEPREKEAFIKKCLKKEPWGWINGAWE